MQFLIDSPSSSFVMTTVDSNQVYTLLKKLNNYKSTIDIPNKLIKLASFPLSIPLTHIYNQSITMGIIPDALKISKVIPVYKNGIMTNPGNYRPIAILSPFAKILERLVYNQLESFLNKYKILSDFQFGFRKGRSTEQAILEMTDQLKTNIDHKKLTCGIFLDLSKAFDTVNHDILLDKMYKYGIRGIPHHWFSDYLRNRLQFVQIDDVKSSMLSIKCGVPQGSTLGPLLFLLYINDIPNCLDKCLSYDLCR